jgi:polysaccharide transporter, PST family
MSTISQTGGAPGLLMADPDRHLRVDQLVHDLRRRSMRGGVISFGAQGVKVLAQFGAVVVLARLLPPEAFGLVAMVAALSLFLDLIKEFGLSAATIQKPDITHGQVSALFWINTTIGAAIALLLLLVAPAIADFYAQPALRDITRWLALGFLVSGATTQHWALLRRQMRFGTIAALETSAEILGFFVSIAAVLLGAGYWALVAQRLTGPVLLLIGCWALCRWRPGWPARAAGLGAIFAFGAAVTGCNFVNALARSVDQILIGWLWGPGILGLYERSAKLQQTPVNNISMPLYAVAMPALSRISDQNRRYRTAFSEILSTLAMLTMPGGALVAMSADWIVALLFGAQWRDAAPLAAFFGIAMAYQPLLAAIGLVYLTQDRSRELLRAGILDSTLAILLILVGLPFGVLGVVAASALGGLALRAPLAVWLASRGRTVGQSELYAAVLPSAMTAVTVACTVWALRRMAWISLMEPAERLVIAVMAATVAAIVTFALIPQSRAALITLARIPRFFRAPKPRTQ